MSDSSLNANDALPVLISNSTFMNHDSATTLFLISSDQGSECASKGLGQNWTLDDQLTFEYLTFNDNTNTRLMDIVCVKVNINRITFNGNEQSAMSFSHYSLPTITHLNSNGNQGTLIELSESATALLQHHYVYNHFGNYLLYNTSDPSFNGGDVLIFKDSNFTACDSFYETNQWFITVHGVISRVHYVQVTIQNVLFNENSGQIVSTYVVDEDVTNVNNNMTVCPTSPAHLSRNEYIQFIDCVFDSNTGNTNDSVFMQYDWAPLVELHASNLFINNNHYDILIQSTDTTLSLDDTQFDDNTDINTYVDFGRRLHLNSEYTSNALCVIDLHVSRTNGATNEFIHLTNITNLDLISITKSRITSPYLNAFVSGFASLDQNEALVTLSQLEISNFSGSFVRFETVESHIININFVDSIFDSQSDQLIYVNTRSTSATKTFTF
eukprot:669610_1